MRHQNRKIDFNGTSWYLVLLYFERLEGDRRGPWGMLRGMRGCERETWEFGDGGMAYIF